MERVTQTEWDARRREAKSEAAEVMAANAREAAEKLAARRRGLGYPVPTPAPEPVAEDEDGDGDEGYSEYTVEELKSFLSERGLTVSGNKAELIERLTESDESADEDEDEDADSDSDDTGSEDDSE
jgi:hypothetical protein